MDNCQSECWIDDEKSDSKDVNTDCLNHDFEFDNTDEICVLNDSIKNSTVDTSVQLLTEGLRKQTIEPTSVLSNNLIRIDPDSRPHLNVIFIGHVDAGKSTTCGNILHVSGHVDERTLEKYEREAKERNRESWYLAFIMDTNEEERAKGKTVEVGRAEFMTQNRRFTILDAPGHKMFVPNMISGAAQADIGVLIISARKGEFETGFDRGGQTREHALLAKTLGVNQLIVAVNKMDDQTCDWDEQRFLEIEKKLIPFLKSCGYNPTTDLNFVPISGLTGQNLLHHVQDSTHKRTYCEKAKWYDLSKPTLWSLFDSVVPTNRDASGPLRIPLLEGYKDNGIILTGKVESGTVSTGMNGVLMPQKMKVKVLAVSIDDQEVNYASPGENIKLKVFGIEEDQVSRGFILCGVENACPVVTEFLARVAIVELLEHRPLITIGYSCVLHTHTACEEMELTEILEVTDKKTKTHKLRPKFVKNDCIILCRIQMAVPICLEEFDKIPQLGRFTLRDEGRTIAIGKVIQLTRYE